MKRGRTSKSLRGWLPTAAASVAAFAMLLQPICAPACAAMHCAARMGSGTAMHCNGAEDQPEASLAAAKRACSSTEALPAILGAEIRHTPNRCAGSSLPTSLTPAKAGLNGEFAFTCPLRDSQYPLPRESSSSLSTILRV
jgi:hypothetical protein